MQRLLKLLVALSMVLGFVATAAHAQAVFRSVMPDGKIIYGDKPAPGAKEAKQVNLKPLNISTPSQGGQGAGEPPPPESGAKNNDVATAQQNLDAAKKALDAGRETREGDRLGVAKGSGATSRASDEYLQRVKSLEDAVAAAQAQLEAAQRAAR